MSIEDIATKYETALMGFTKGNRHRTVLGIANLGIMLGKTAFDVMADIRRCRDYEPSFEKELLDAVNKAAKEVAPVEKFDQDQKFFDWDDELPGTKQVIRADYVDPVPIIEPTKEWDTLGDLRKYVEAVFRPGEKVSICVNAQEKDENGVRTYHPASKGFLVDYDKFFDERDREVEEIVGDYNKASGAWVRVNPMGGHGGNDADVAVRRHSLIECDTMDVDKQLGIIRKLALPCSAIVHSGRKSIHAIVRVDAKDEQEYMKRVDFLYATCESNGLAIDRQNRNASRYSRLPGIWRGDGKQFLIDVNCGKPTWDEWVEYIEDLGDDLPEIEDSLSFIDEPPPMADEVIHGILRRRHKMLLSGPPKAGKSYLLMELAIAVATGTQWCGWEVTQSKVLYVNLELDDASCKNRLHDLSVRTGLKPKRGDLMVWNLRGSSSPLAAISPKLVRRVKDMDLGMIIIDPIYKVMMGDENSATEMGKFCNQFDFIARTTGASIVYCHHHSKGDQGQKRAQDRASGSGVFARDPDAVIDLIELNATQDDRDWFARRQEARDIREILDREKPSWRGGASKEDMASAFWLRQYAGFNNVDISGMTNWMEKMKTATGWRIEGILREFPSFAPKKTWFVWPIHIPDDGVLDKAVASGEKVASKVKEKEVVEQRRKFNDMQLQEFALAFEDLTKGGDGPIHMQKIADKMGKSLQHVRNLVNGGQLDSLVIKKPRSSELWRRK